MRTSLALASLIVLLAAPLARAQDEPGLPPPARGAAQPEIVAPPKLPFDRITVRSGHSTMTVEPDGTVFATYPLSPFLASMGVTIPWMVSDRLTPGELAAIKDAVATDGAISGLHDGGPLWDFRILSHEPILIDVERTKVGKDGKPVQVEDHFENSGEPTPMHGIVGAAGVLNGILDRVTNGSVYGAGTSIEGVITKRQDSEGNASYYVTEDSGRRTAIGDGDVDDGSWTVLGYQIVGPTPGPGLSQSGYDSDLASLVGQRVRVHGLVDGSSGAVRSLVVTREIVTLPEKPRPLSYGITDALRAAGESK